MPDLVERLRAEARAIHKYDKSGNPIESYAIWQAADEIIRLRAEREKMVECLRKLLDHVDRETCTHDETHRGGGIWTICDECGMKWADDRGGFVPYKDPPAVEQARSLFGNNGAGPTDDLPTVRAKLCATDAAAQSARREALEEAAAEADRYGDPEIRDAIRSLASSIEATGGGTTTDTAGGNVATGDQRAEPVAQSGLQADAELHFFEWTDTLRRVRGHIVGDRKFRYNDGDLITTSKILTNANGFIQTENSVYRLVPRIETLRLAKLGASIEANTLVAHGNEPSGPEAVKPPPPIVTELPSGEWQDIETVMPKAGERVLVYCERGTRIRIAFSSGEGHWLADGGTSLYPTHWIPLPAPPSNERGRHGGLD